MIKVPSMNAHRGFARKNERNAPLAYLRSSEPGGNWITRTSYELIQKINASCSQEVFSLECGLEIRSMRGKVYLMVRRVNESITERFGSDATLDQGLRAYMLKVYNYMALGLGLTGAVAFFLASSPSLLYAVAGGPLLWVFMLAPLGVVFFLSFAIDRISASTAQLLFWLYAGLMGVSMGTIAVAFTLESLARVFFITASTFAGMSLYGYTTKKDLSKMGSFLFMGLIGIILASLVNLFLKSTGMQFVLSVLTVLVFTGLTAYDTQVIRGMYTQHAGSEAQGKMAILGALRLYLDFINIFISLLHLMGERR